MAGHIFGVMAGLVPAIHAFVYIKAAKTWMPATSAGMTASVAMRNTPC
jgi:hypothetical protein